MWRWPRWPLWWRLPALSLGVAVDVGGGWLRLAALSPQSGEALPAACECVALALVPDEPLSRALARALRRLSRVPRRVAMALPEAAMARCRLRVSDALTEEELAVLLLAEAECMAPFPPAELALDYVLLAAADAEPVAQDGAGEHGPACAARGEERAGVGAEGIRPAAVGAASGGLGNDLALSGMEEHFPAGRDDLSCASGRTLVATGAPGAGDALVAASTATPVAPAAGVRSAATLGALDTGVVAAAPQGAAARGLVASGMWHTGLGAVGGDPGSGSAVGCSGQGLATAVGSGGHAGGGLGSIDGRLLELAVCHRGECRPAVELARAVGLRLARLTPAASAERRGAQLLADGLSLSGDAHSHRDGSLCRPWQLAVGLAAGGGHNLLPWRARRRRRADGRLLAAAMALLLLGQGSALAARGTLQRGGSLQSAHNAAHRQQLGVQRQRSHSAQLHREREVATRAVAAGRRARWHRAQQVATQLWATLAAARPAQVSYERIELRGGTLRLEGVGAHLASVSRLMRRLNAEELFRRVELRQLQARPPGASAQRFVLELSLSQEADGLAGGAP